MSYHHIVQFSGGVCSFFAAKRVVEKFGPENVVLLFADTMMEDEDLYRFLAEGAKFLKAQLIIIQEGRNPWEVFKDERYIGNSRVDPCSKILKREFLDKWCIANGSPTCVRYFGLDWTETERFERLQARFESMGVARDRIQAPMIWKPLVDKPDMLMDLVKLGIQIPRLYKIGYNHNNCGGFCIKSGQAQFRLLLATNPERYAFHEAREQDLRQFLEKDVAVLRDRRGGKSRPMTLKEFRQRIEAGGEHDKHDHGGCGCAID